MLARVVRLLSSVVDREQMVIVAAAGQELPKLPPEPVIVRDERDSQGPLEGLRGGLAALTNRVDAAYATSCDVPLLVPAFVERMFDLLGDDDIAAPVEGKFRHPLSAVYRPTVTPHIEDLLASDQRRPAFLFDRCRTRFVPVDELREVDPQLSTLRNLNTPEDYQAALHEAGFDE